jgi:hypothetical protein
MEVRAFWHCRYWDGPLSGMASINGGKFVWYECVQDRDPRIVSDDEYAAMTEEQQECVWETAQGRTTMTNRVYALYELTEEQIEAQFRIHDEWEAAGMYHRNYYPLIYKPYIQTEKTLAYLEKYKNAKGRTHSTWKRNRKNK